MIVFLNSGRLYIAYTL